MTRHEIAAERNLAVSTVTGHLATFIPSGELTVDDILTPSVCTQIASAVKRAGIGSGYAAIQALLPASISSHDVRLYLNNAPSLRD
ncbi:MAG: helix-turn-helix domain-containing protein [[Clostridium] fimetarium]|nr:helix-turn-helix domain-containing protein [Alistipes timonensis]MCM1405992.1 helix-turn-helix domain-containing protein [[Clostridium] fimetarium]